MGIVLQTPSVISFKPFDPSFDFAVKFIYDGNQSVKNRVVITDNASSLVVYDEVQTTMKLQHTIPANTLAVGKRYLLQLQVLDSDGNSSNLSDAVLFYCFTTPTFNFNNITDGMTYKNTSITLAVNYSQPDNEQLKSLQFLKYSYDKTLLTQSNIFHSLAGFSFNGLQNNTTYYFRAVGETVHGLPLDTGYVKVNVEYKTLPANIIFSINNNYCEGYIKLISGIKDIEYKFDNDSYELKDGLLTLKNNSLIYMNSFSINSDFVLFVEAKNLPLQKFLTANNDEFSLSIVNICDVYYCKLSVKNSELSMFAPLPKARLSTDRNELIITDDGKMIEIVNTSYDDDSLVVFEVKRIGGNYSLNSYYKSEMES